MLVDVGVRARAQHRYACADCIAALACSVSLLIASRFFQTSPTASLFLCLAIHKLATIALMTPLAAAPHWAAQGAAAWLDVVCARARCVGVCARVVGGAEARHAGTCVGGVARR